uniref:Putative capsid protein n=1 Tax=Vai augu virus TaxID=2800949 RepID=A0A894KLB4_9VIRU|nr:MAG: putative capsid protein [Vai augu virus]
MFGTWEEKPRMAGHGLYAQHMGGHAEITATTSWNEQATVSVLDPMTCPGFIGNKMNGASYPARSVDGERFRYYGIGDMDAETQSLSEIKSMCANTYSLVGSSADARVVFEQRVIPNSQEWVWWSPPTSEEVNPADTKTINRWYCEHGGISPYVAFTGTGPLYILTVPPSGELSLKVDVWLSYNVQLDPSTSVGKLLFLECPVSVFHACDINLLPTGVACDTQATVAQQQLSSAYSGGRINKAIRTSSGYTGRSLQAASIPKENFIMRISNWVKNTGAPTARSVIGAIKAAIDTGKAIGGMF